MSDEPKEDAMTKPATDKLLAILDGHLAAVAEKHRSAMCVIDRETVATLAELLRQLSKPTRSEI